MSDYAAQFQQTLSHLDRTFASNGLLSQFESSTKLPRSYAILGLGALYFVLIFVNLGGIGQLLSNFAGFVIPGYYSLVALSTTQTNDDTQLLTYWVVFAFLNVIEFWSKAILYWIPFYWFFKTIFLLYLAFPQFGGAQFVFNSFIKPLTDKYIISNKKVDSFADKVENAAEGVASGAARH